MRQVAREASNSLWSSRRYVREAREEKEEMVEKATQDASKSAKDEGISTEEASDLVEESRDSAIAETQEKTNKQQHKFVLLIFFSIIAFIVFGGGPDPSGY